MTENAEQHLIIFPNLSPISIHESINSIRYSHPCDVTTNQRYNSSVWINIQDPVITQHKIYNHLISSGAKFSTTRYSPNFIFSLFSTMDTTILYIGTLRNSYYNFGFAAVGFSLVVEFAVGSTFVVCCCSFADILNEDDLRDTNTN